MATPSVGELSLDLITRPRYRLGRSALAGLFGLTCIVWATGGGAESVADRLGAVGFGGALLAAALWWAGRQLSGWRRVKLTIGRAGVGYRGSLIGWAELTRVDVAAVNAEQGPVGYLVLSAPDPEFGTRHPALRARYFAPDDTFRIELGAAPDTLNRVHAALAAFAGPRYPGPVNPAAGSAGAPGRPLGELRLELPGPARSGVIAAGLLCLALGGGALLGALTGRVEGAPPIAVALVGALFVMIGAASLAAVGGKSRWWLVAGPAGVRMEGADEFAVRWDELAAVYLSQRRRRDRYGRTPPSGLLTMLPTDPGFGERHPEMSTLCDAEGGYVLPLGEQPDVFGRLDQALRLLAGGRYAGIRDARRGLNLT